jgi:hypothetical protein
MSWRPRPGVLASPRSSRGACSPIMEIHELEAWHPWLRVACLPAGEGSAHEAFRYRPIDNLSRYAPMTRRVSGILEGARV